MLMKSTMQLQELPLNVSARPVCDKGFVPGSDVCGEGGEEVLSDVKSWERTRKEIYLPLVNLKRKENEQRILVIETVPTDCRSISVGMDPTDFPYPSISNC